MEGCKWQNRIMSIDDDVDAMLKRVAQAKKTSVCHEESKVIQSCIRRIRKERKKLIAMMEKETISSVRLQMKEQADQLGRDEDQNWAEHRQKTSRTEIGEFNLIIEGLREFTVILKTSNKLEGKSPQSDCEWLKL